MLECHFITFLQYYVEKVDTTAIKKQQQRGVQKINPSSVLVI